METKTFTAKVKLTEAELEKSEELGRIPENASYSTVDSKGNDLPDGKTEISTDFEIDVPTTKAEAEASAKALHSDGIVAIIAERVVTKARNEIAASMRPTESKTAQLKAENAKAKSFSERLVAAKAAGDSDAVDAIIDEMVNA